MFRIRLIDPNHLLILQLSVRKKKKEVKMQLENFQKRWRIKAMHLERKTTYRWSLIITNRLIKYFTWNREDRRNFTVVESSSRNIPVSCENHDHERSSDLFVHLRVVIEDIQHGGKKIAQHLKIILRR